MVELVDTECHVTATYEGVLVFASQFRVAGLHAARGFGHRLDRVGQAWLPRVDL